MPNAVDSENENASEYTLAAEHVNRTSLSEPGHKSQASTSLAALADDTANGDSVCALCQQLDLAQLRVELERSGTERRKLEAKIDRTFLVNVDRLFEQDALLCRLEDAIESQEQALRRLVQEFHHVAVKRANQLPALRTKLRRLRESVKSSTRSRSWQSLAEVRDRLEQAIRHREYDEALSLYANLRTMSANLGKASLEKEYLETQMSSLETMLAVSILEELSEATSLSKCIEMSGFLRTFDFFDNAELRRLFLHCRGRYIWRFISDAMRALDALPTETRERTEAIVVLQLSRLTDALRQRVLKLFTEYRTLFSNANADDDASDSVEGDALLVDEAWCAWHREWLTAYLLVVEKTIARVSDVVLIQTLFTQTMAFAAALGRLELDFRPLLVPLYERAVLRVWQRKLHDALLHYSRLLRSLDLDSINPEVHMISSALVGSVDASPETTASGDGAVEPAPAPASTPKEGVALSVAPIAQLQNEIESAILQLGVLVPSRHLGVFANELCQALKDAGAVIAELLVFPRLNTGAGHVGDTLIRALRSELVPRVMQRFREATEIPAEELAPFEEKLERFYCELDHLPPINENHHQYNS
jgi:hypothetical protein